MRRLLVLAPCSLLSSGWAITDRLDITNHQLGAVNQKIAETNLRLGDAQARLLEVNQRLDETNRKLNTVEQAILQSPVLRPNPATPPPPLPRCRSPNRNPWHADAPHLSGSEDRARGSHSNLLIADRDEVENLACSDDPGRRWPGFAFNGLDESRFSPCSRS